MVGYWGHFVCSLAFGGILMSQLQKTPNFKQLWGRAGKHAIFVNCKFIACARCFFNSDLAKFLAGCLFRTQTAVSHRPSTRRRRTKHDTCTPDQPLIDHGHLPMVVGAVAPTTAPTAASASPPPQPLRRTQRRPYGPPVGARGRLWRLLSTRQ